MDTLLMGKATFNHLMTLVDEFPHADRTCFVFSRTEKRPDQYVEYVNENVGDFTEKLLKCGGSDIWLVGGATLLDAFLKEQLVDEFIITVAPVILGEGIPLFKRNNPEIGLKLIGQKRFGQFTQLHYTVE